jgi:hypothetical protein
MTIVHLFAAIILTCALLAGWAYGWPAAFFVLVAAVAGVWAVCARLVK